MGRDRVPAPPSETDIFALLTARFPNYRRMLKRAETGSSDPRWIEARQYERELRSKPARELRNSKKS
jgi:hypothetical protein